MTASIVLIGDPINHTRSPAMQNAAFERLGLSQDYRYTALRVTEGGLGIFISDMRNGTFAGANVTLPHKTAILDHLDSVTDESRITRSVNTIYWDGSALAGDTTDGKGAVIALQERGLSLQGKTIALIGAGGAARSIAFSLGLASAGKLIILNRSIPAAKLLTAEIMERIGTPAQAGPLTRDLHDCEIIINCTSVGMEGFQEHESPIDIHQLPAFGTVMDIVYAPRMTTFLKYAEKRGLTIIDGISMLINQGALSFKRWTGFDAPREAMRKALENEE